MLPNIHAKQKSTAGARSSGTQPKSIQESFSVAPLYKEGSATPGDHGKLSEGGWTPCDRIPPTWIWSQLVLIRTRLHGHAVAAVHGSLLSPDLRVATARHSRLQRATGSPPLQHALSSKTDRETSPYSRRHHKKALTTRSTSHLAVFGAAKASFPTVSCDMFSSGVHPVSASQVRRGAKVPSVREARRSQGARRSLAPCGTCRTWLGPSASNPRALARGPAPRSPRGIQVPCGVSAQGEGVHLLEARGACRLSLLLRLLQGCDETLVRLNLARLVRGV